MEIANGVEPVQDGRIFIELLNGPFLFEFKGSPTEYGAIASMLGAGQSWSFIRDLTGCSRATVAKMAKRLKHEEAIQ
jgi:hypothetical protein